MESVQKFILSTALFLLIITIGTHKSYAKIVDDSTFYTSFYQQQKTPFEKTIHFLFLNKLADLPQPVCSLEEISGNFSAYLPIRTIYIIQLPNLMLPASARNVQILIPA